MSFLGGALDKLPPRDRVRQHFMRDLELRRNDERAAADFPSSSYYYRGSADLLLRHGRFWSGRELPEAYERHQGPGNECYWNALDAAEANPELTYCEGVYTVGFGLPNSHAWCVDPNGGLVELTFPTDPELRPYMRNKELGGMRFLGPEHWGYYGATFDAAFVRAYANEYGLPLFDRSRAELADSERDGRFSVSARSREAFHADELITDGDFPILKYAYNSTRTDLP